MMLRRIITKNSVNGGALLSSWKLRDDAIRNLLIKHFDGNDSYIRDSFESVIEKVSKFSFYYAAKHINV
ncbi:hypothetical protein OUZ56_009932 [Daphnia magna]|uniref:Uncharacterized protein n=1 Tax=Daphnia magna TaxID=35525 RepID=A0ABR0AHA1_9CRUS|nr:hypothetical protein OUZ56_009932 [Daphnia magna]